VPRMAGEDREQERIEAAVRRMAARMAGHDRAAADDLVSEGMAAALSALSDADPDRGPVLAYVLRRARWRMTDWMRRERRERCLPLAPDTPARPPLLDRREATRRITIRVSEYDYRRLEDLAARIGPVTISDITRAAIRLLCDSATEG